MHLIDQMQRSVELVKPARRIVSLVPSQTELLFAMGAGDSVVGITKFCTEPSEAVGSITKVGGTKQFDFVKIAALKPDLIIGNKEENYQEGVERLAQDHTVWMSDIADLDDALEMIRGLGALSGVAEVASQMATTIASRFSDLSEVSFREAKVAYLIWQKPYMVSGGSTFIDVMLQYGGMQNVFASQERYPEVTMEAIRASGAEAVLLSSEPFPFREKHLQAFQTALPDKKIVLVDAMPFSWYGSQLLRTSAYLRELRTIF